MIRLLATLGSAALVIWGVDLALDTGSWREPAARVSEGVADALDTLAETAELAARPSQLESSTLDATHAGLPDVSARREFEPDLGPSEDSVGSLLPEGGASALHPAPTSARELSRLQAEEIRSRLDRVMDLARGPSP